MGYRGGRPERSPLPRKSSANLLVFFEKGGYLPGATAGSSELWRPENPSIAFQSADFSSSSADWQKPARRIHTLLTVGRFSLGDLQIPDAVRLTGRYCRAGVYRVKPGTPFLVAFALMIPDTLLVYVDSPENYHFSFEPLVIPTCQMLLHLHRLR